MDSGSLFHFSGHCGIRDFRWFISISVSHTVTSRQPGFDLPLLNRFRRRKWRLSDTDLCPCGETQTMSHIVESCHLTKLNGGLSRLHSADEDAVSWLTNYGKWHAYEKKKKCQPAVITTSHTAKYRDSNAWTMWTPSFRFSKHCPLQHFTKSPIDNGHV